MTDDAPQSSTGDVLVIDDEVLIRDLIVEILTDEGYAVRSARDANAGLRAIEDATPAFLLLDIQMPGMPGNELLRVLRAMGYTFPIALITASPQTAESLLDMGSVVCVAKPFDLDELLACVARHVQPTMPQLRSSSP
jgi:two-component system nitrogen regulation response regulator NtrX